MCVTSQKYIFNRKVSEVAEVLIFSRLGISPYNSARLSEFFSASYDSKRNSSGLIQRKNTFCEVLNVLPCYEGYDKKRWLQMDK